MKIVKSLRNFLFFNFSLVVILPIMLISFLVLHLVTLDLKEEVQDKNLLLARNLMGQIDQFLNEPQNIINQIARIIDSHNFNQSQLNTYLDAINNNYQFFDMIQILDNQGRVTQVVPYNEDYLGISMSGQDFYKNAVATNRLYWSPTFISSKTGQPTLTICRSLSEGMVVGYLNLGSLNDINDKVNIGQTSWVGIVDSNGTYISHTDRINVYQRLNAKDQSLVRQGLLGKTGTYQFKNQQGEFLASVVMVARTGWPIIVAQSATDAFASVTLVRNVFLAGMLISFLLAIIIAINSLKKILGPLNELSGKAKAVSGGNYNSPMLYDSFNELNELAGDFKTMVQAIKSRETEIRESRELYVLATQGANDGIWDWNLETDVLYLSPRFEEMFGYNNDQIKYGSQLWNEQTHPDDREKVQSLLKQHLEGKTEHYQNEYRIRHQDGSERWILVRGLAIRDQDNHPYRMAGSITDITERKKAEEQIRLSLREKEVLLKEIHHRVKNNMQVISSLLHLQGEYLDNPKYLELLKESQNRIKTMALVHEKLYQSNDLTKINFKDYIINLTNSIFRSYGTSLDQVELILEIADLRLGVDAAIPCGLIINELVSNALKHAFPNGRKGFIKIDFSKIGNEFELRISDNGLGIPKAINFRNTKSLGLQLVITLVENQLQGECILDTEQGTDFRIKFKEDK